MDTTILEKVNTDSVKISRNAKGDYAYEVKVYGDLKDEAGVELVKLKLRKGLDSVKAEIL